MIKILQNTLKFTISRFQAARKAIQQAQKMQDVGPKISKDEKIGLWALYKQATGGQNTQMPYWSTSVPDPSSTRIWSQYQGRSKQQAEQDYIKMVKNVLMKNGVEDLIKEF